MWASRLVHNGALARGWSLWLCILDCNTTYMSTGTTHDKVITESHVKTGKGEGRAEAFSQNVTASPRSFPAAISHSVCVRNTRN
jgi:hypothetical protein